VDVSIKHVLEFAHSDKSFLLLTTLDNAVLKNVRPGVKL
jgi:hypothetical protein